MGGSGVRMRLATTDSVPPGTVLARDVVVAPTSGPLLRQGVALTDGMRSALLTNGIGRIWVDDELGEGIEPTGILGELLRRDVLAAVAAMHAEARQALTRAGRLDGRTVEALGDWAARMADDVVDRIGWVHDLLDLAPPSHYLVHHAVDSAALAMLVAHRHMTTVGWRRARRRPCATTRRGRSSRASGSGSCSATWACRRCRGPCWRTPAPLDEAGWEQVRRHPVTGRGAARDEHVVRPQGDRPRSPRALGRLGVPGRDGGRRHPVPRADRRRGGRLRRHDRRAAPPPGDVAGRRLVGDRRRLRGRPSTPGPSRRSARSSRSTRPGPRWRCPTGAPASWPVSPSTRPPGRPSASARARASRSWSSGSSAARSSSSSARTAASARSASASTQRHRTPPSMTNVGRP